MVIMFYIFASFKQIWISKYTDFVEATIESGEGGEGGKILFGYKRYESSQRLAKIILWFQGTSSSKHVAPVCLILSAVGRFI